MDLLDLLRGQATGPQAMSAFSTCRARTVLADSSLSPDDQAEALRHIRESGIPATRLVQYFASYNLPMSTAAIWRHRRGECSCPTTEDTE